MKSLVKLYILVAIVGFASCESDEPKELTYLEYLNDKAIIDIQIRNDNKYIFTSRYCDTCYVAPHMSSIPTIEEWTVVKKDSIYENFSARKFFGLTTADYNGNLYFAKEKSIYKIKDNGENELLVNLGDYLFQSFTFDKDDNVWFYSQGQGIACWNKSELKIYNTQNSQLPTNIIHGLAVDTAGVVWVALDFKGVLKIDKNIWTVIPNSTIPGLKTNSYLRGPKIIANNSVWFEVFNSDTTSNIIKYENGKWIYEFPDESTNCKIKVDANGTIWSFTNHFDYSTYKYSTLKYYQNNLWVNYDISDINKQITTVNADDKKVYIGTIKGLIEKSR